MVPPNLTSKKQRRSASCQSTSSTAPTRQLKKKKDLNLHKLIFEDDGILEGTEVAYYSKGKPVLKGQVRASGIYCCHCRTEISPSEFEKHAENGSKKRPYSYIRLMNGISLHEVALYLREVRAAIDNKERTADTEKVLLCDTCRSFFYKDSPSLSTNSLGERHCKLCKKDCLEHKSFPVSSGSVAECKKCMAGNQEERDIVCAICRGYNFCNCQFALAIIICSQCEKEYHMGCLENHPNLKERPEGNWFCRSGCNAFFTNLQNLIEEVGKQNYIDFFLESIQKEHKDKLSMIVASKAVGWSIVNTKFPCTDNEWRSEVSIIFHENFGRIRSSVNDSDIIEDMVDGKGENSTMYCAVVKDGSSIVAAGLIRILGQDLVELPLAATAKAKHGMGYIYLLMGCLEMFLARLNVRMLAIPATEQSESMWKKKFGFKNMSPQQLSAYEDNCWGRTDFKDTTMLCKSLT